MTEEEQMRYNSLEPFAFIANRGWWIEDEKQRLTSQWAVIAVIDVNES